jgi:hypothetical protein
MSGERNIVGCVDVQDDLALVLEGLGRPELYEHIESCAACRTVRRDADRAARLVAAAGDDWIVPTSLESRLLAELDARDSKRVEDQVGADTPAPPAPASLIARIRGRAPLIAGAAALAAAVAFLVVRVLARRHDPLAAGPLWTGRVAEVLHAGKDASRGLRICPRSGPCEDMGTGAVLAPGARAKTDGRTRARIELADGTKLTLDRDTELELSGTAGRTARVVRGTVTADVIHVDASRAAHLTLAFGDVEVLGTKLQLGADEEEASVTVARGSVRLRDRQGRSVTVRSGELGRLSLRGEPEVGPSDVLTLDDEEPEPNGDRDAARIERTRGIGELRAKKPGAASEQDRGVRLARHEVKIRIVDNVARTEVDETFANDSSDELEGIYRFPLPPGAQIERLALEIDGRLEDGAFVARDQGAAIWRGILQHAAPRAEAPKEEIIWVPGPWRDPALLEWERGGRFELRIFPIPAKGSRRVVLAYTETLPPHAGVRRYTYPLAYDAQGATTIDEFGIDVQVLGHDRTFGVHPRGYALAAPDTKGADAVPDGAERRTMSARAFVPAGDLSVEYALPHRDAELTAWAYRPATDLDHDDANAYVAIALRPDLPRWMDDDTRPYVIAVDSSRSMFGERWSRARRLVAAMIREMDPGDRFLLLACDSVCRSMPGALSASGPSAAAQASQFLEAIEPDGATDLLAIAGAAQDALAAAKGDSAAARGARIVYVGDGSVGAGPSRPAHVAAEVKRVLSSSSSMTVVSVGADADNDVLAALARGGGGVVVPYLPGASAAATARGTLSAARGRTLRNAALKLPDGLSAVAPRTLDTIAAGSETIVVARLAQGRAQVDGNLELEGNVGGEAYHRTLPIRIVPTGSEGNAFVPRLYAAARIDDLQRTEGDTARDEIVRLSRRFAVASRYTSLLVLESEAMFRAYGLERGKTLPTWTGEAAAESSTPPPVVEESLAVAAKPAAAHRVAPVAASPSPPLSALSGLVAGPSKPSAPPGPLVPMRRTWVRSGRIGPRAGMSPVEESRLRAAKAALWENTNRREAVRDLYRLLAYEGRLDEARSIAKEWTLRDPLDPDALAARSDLAARSGDRENAVRILGGIVDLYPEDAGAQTRLAKIEETLGHKERACAHRITLSEARFTDTEIMTSALRCARDLQMTDLANDLLKGATDTVRRAVEIKLASPEEPTDGLSGDVEIRAHWSDPVDLDFALIDEHGQRLSWLGAGKTAVSARDVTGMYREAISFAKLPPGRYVLEVSRAEGKEPFPSIAGEIEGTLVQTRQSLPFVVDGARTQVGIVDIRLEARLEPVPGARPSTQFSSSDIQRIVQSHRAFVKRQCWEPAYATKPPSAPSSARVIVSLDIAPDGHVASARAAGGDGFPGLASCVEALTKVWRFPPSDGASVKVPFVFAAQ